MGEITKIAWTDHTYNLGWGCTKKSAGCLHCYAETWAIRMGYDVWGPGKTRKRNGAPTLHEPIKWNREAEKAGQRRRVFCASMMDWTDPEWADMLPGLWQMWRDTPWLDWLMLTKNEHRITLSLPADWGNGYPNVCMGVTAENQEMADRRIQILFQIPARIRFVSIEPMLGPINILKSANVGRAFIPCDFSWHIGGGIQWIIIGGESGKNCRPFVADWARDVMRQCRSAGVAVFMKQLGGYPDKHDDPVGWAEDLRVREFPQESAQLVKCASCGDLCEPTIVVGVCDPCVRQHGADIVANKSGN